MDGSDHLPLRTTNLVNDFDAAILNRIQLRMKYEDLDKNRRKTIIAQLLKKVNEGRGSSNISREYLDRFACVSLNGREVSCWCERGRHW
jgi:ATP-dependent Clp protease ATP-binding subunit ClpA